MHPLLPRHLRSALPCALAGILVVSGVVAVSASQHDDDGNSSTTTTTGRSTETTAGLPGGPTSTTSPPSTTTTATDAPPGEDEDPPVPPDDAGGNGPQGDGAGSGGAQIIPPEYRARIAAIKRTRANNTAALIDAVRPLIDRGLTEQEAAIVGFGQFPIAGYATFTDDWWFARFNPTFHLHEGTDVFAPMGTPVRAPVNGVLRTTTGPVGGLAVYVRSPDGTDYYMAHLSAFAEPQDGQAVTVGQVIGYVGNTGNAAGGATHVHFEIHPRGGQPVPPKPYLDRWIEEAVRAAPALIATFDAGRPRAVVATGLTRHFNDLASAPDDHVSSPRQQLLWAGAASPTGGALRIAADEAASVAHDIDWDRRAAAYERVVAQWVWAESRAKAILAPLTPPVLRSFLAY